MKLSKCDRSLFIKFITSDKRDAFARTFVLKADMQKIWDWCYSAIENDEILGAFILTKSKRQPYISNFQLVHTFAKARSRGVGSYLLQKAFEMAKQNGSEYFRVSSEKTAVDFYKKNGVKFIGKQKSGCLLSVFKLDSDTIKGCTVAANDPVVRSQIFGNRKGSIVEVFDEYNERRKTLI